MLLGNLVGGEAGTDVPQADEGVLVEAESVKDFTAFNAVLQVWQGSVAEYGGRIGEVDAYVVKHGGFADEVGVDVVCCATL